MGIRDFLQGASECILEADAGNASINGDRAFEDWGFHERVSNSFGVFLKYHSDNSIFRGASKYRVKKIMRTFASTESMLPQRY
jgi:hypothetical protein